MTTNPLLADPTTATPEDLAVFRAHLRELSRTLENQAQSLEAIGAWGVLGHAYREDAIARYNRSAPAKQTGPLSRWDPRLYPPGFDVAAFRGKLEAYQAQRATDNLRPKAAPASTGERTARLVAMAEGLTEAQMASIEAQGGFAAVLVQHAELFRQAQDHLAREQSLNHEVQDVLRQAAPRVSTRPRSPR
jgi:hypothetical protein